MMRVEKKTLKQNLYNPKRMENKTLRFEKYKRWNIIQRIHGNEFRK